MPVGAPRARQPRRPRVLRQGADRRLRRGGRDQPPGDAGSATTRPRRSVSCASWWTDPRHADQPVQHVVPALLGTAVGHVRRRRVRHGDGACRRRPARTSRPRCPRPVSGSPSSCQTHVNDQPPRRVDLGVDVPVTVAPIAGPWIRNAAARPRVHVVRRAGQLRPPPGGELLGVGPRGEDPLRAAAATTTGDGDRARVHGLHLAARPRRCPRCAHGDPARASAALRHPPPRPHPRPRARPRRDRLAGQPPRVPVGLHPGHRDRLPARLRHPHHLRAPGPAPASSSTTASSGTTTPCWSRRRPRSRASTPSAAMRRCAG